jgi:superoxide dismutase, Cu-Zn family
MSYRFIHARRVFPLAGALVAIGFTAGLAATAATGAEQAKATFQDGAGKQVGTATLTQTPAGVLIELDLKGLPPGEKAFHVHERGSCDAAGGFKSAGDHYDPRHNQHGLQAAKGPHAGDMPNQFVPQDGSLRAHVLNTAVTLTPGAASLFDGDGSALVLHSKADDYRSQPAGNAGDRIACGVVERSPG